MQVTEAIGRLPRLARALLGVALLAAVGAADYLAGPELSLAAFYLVPVTFFAWFVARWAGIASAMGSAGLSLIPELRIEPHYHEPAAPYWNALMHLGIFLFAAFILDEIKDLYEREKQLSRHDFLTGVLNERAFAEVLAAEQERATRYSYPLTLAYIDLDDFKQVNDRWGHAAGDTVLRAMGGALRSSIRDSDTVARLGGDEFAVLLPQTGGEAGNSVLQKLRAVLLRSMEESRWPVTCSIGAVTFESAPPAPPEMIKRADQAMYAVKASGKNQMKQEVVG